METHTCPTKSENCFTAAQLAAALNIKKRRFWKRMQGIAPRSKTIVRGNETEAWGLDQVPQELRARLVRRAAQNGATVADWIENCSKPWEPKIPLGQVAEPYINAASKLRDALLPALETMGSASMTPDTLTDRGLRDYERVFGHSISHRHWRRLFDRTVSRDGGAGCFRNRLELYLHENPARKPSADQELTLPEEFEDLKGTIRSFNAPAAPSNSEAAGLWAEVFELYSMHDSGKQAGRLRNALVRFLWSEAPALAKSSNALRVAFYRKFEAWKASGASAAALLDGRTAKRGESRAQAFPQGDLDAITWEAAAHKRGRIAPAVRELERQGRLSAETLALLSDDAGSKSYLNRRLVKSVRSDVELVRPYVLGKRAIDNSLAAIERDRSGMRSMQVVTADDFTLNNYFHVPDGAGWFKMTRGQCLLVVDCRSLRILGFSLQPESNYCGLVIRSLQNKVCRQWGLPNTWYFERGIWERAKVVKNAAPPHWDVRESLAAIKSGWEGIGVKFVHATRARSKPVELVGGLLQALLDGLPGDCGRDERRELPEATKKALEAVNGHRESPEGKFFSFQEWQEQLASKIELYNSTRQEGRILQGLSPDEAFEKYWPHDNPPTPYDANCWHLFAHYVSERQVTKDGIQFNIGNRRYRYFDERTSRDRGKQVLAWFDPECPEILGVTDLNCRNPYTVARAGTAPFAAGPDDPDYARELQRAAAHNSYPKARYQVLAAKFKPSFRTNLVDRATAEVARTFQTERASVTEAQEQRRNRVQATIRKADDLGIDRALLRNATPDQLDAVNLIAAARREHQAEVEREAN